MLRDVGIDQKLDQQVPLDLAFVEETGRPVELKEYFGQKPVVLALVYYECPMLCTEILNGLLRSLKDVSLDMGKDFTVLAVSINPREKPSLAMVKKRLYAGMYLRPGAQEGWHFLTGEDPSIQLLANAVGFRYAYDPVSAQYAHATGIMILTPQGKISRYFYGIAFSPRDLRFGLVEASANKIGSPVDQVLLFCYHYDAISGKYGLVITNVIRIAGLATVLALGTLMLVLFRHEKHVRE
jgi:protein SCO1/2